MELLALKAHVILVKVISGFGLHVFFHQYVANVWERKSENVFRTVSEQSSLLISLSASSSALTLPRNPAKFSSSTFSLDRFQPLRGRT